MLAHDCERALERYQKTFGIAGGVTVTSQALDEGGLVGYQLFAGKNVTPSHFQRRFPILLHAECYARCNGLRNRRICGKTRLGDQECGMPARVRVRGRGMPPREARTSDILA